MSNKRKPHYWDVTIHIIDRPVDKEDYFTGEELVKEVLESVDLPAGVKAKNGRARPTVRIEAK